MTAVTGTNETCWLRPELKKHDEGDRDQVKKTYRAQDKEILVPHISSLDIYHANRDLSSFEIIRWI